MGQSKYTYSSWPASFKKNVYIFTSFFWKKLIKIKDKKDTNKETVKQLFRWTKHIKNIFEKKYLIIPKCDNLHWELIIICFPGKVLKKYQNEINDDDDDEDMVNDEDREQEAPCIAILDSMCGNRKHSEFKLIRKWLNLEAENRRKCESVNDKKEENEGDDDLVEFDEIFTAKTMTGYCVKVPRQPNSHDCGCFLLRNVLQFGYDEGFKDTSTKKGINLSDWYEPSQGVEYRQIISKTLARLIQEQAMVTTGLRNKFEEKKKEFIRSQIRNRKQKEKAANNNFKGYESD